MKTNILLLFVLLTISACAENLNKKYIIYPDHGIYGNAENTQIIKDVSNDGDEYTLFIHNDVEFYDCQKECSERRGASFPRSLFYQGCNTPLYQGEDLIACDIILCSSNTIDYEIKNCRSKKGH